MKNRGMTLFIAMVIMGVLLLVSFAVVNIAVKSTLFAGAGRDSQYAFYAADSGIECAEYWDSKFDSFATSTAGGVSCGPMVNILTNSQSVPTNPAQPSLIGGGGDGSVSIFYFDMNQGVNAAPYCSIVEVTKYYMDTNGDGVSELMTNIRSRGYNTCDTSNPRRVERGVSVTY
jgi:hypothetical protein